MKKKRCDHTAAAFPPNSFTEETYLSIDRRTEKTLETKKTKTPSKKVKSLRIERNHPYFTVAGTRDYQIIVWSRSMFMYRSGWTLSFSFRFSYSPGTTTPNLDHTFPPTWCRHWHLPRASLHSAQAPDTPNSILCRSQVHRIRGSWTTQLQSWTVSSLWPASPVRTTSSLQHRLF